MKWQYKILPVTPTSLTTIAPYGMKGWELCQILVESPGSTMVAVLKRSEQEYTLYKAVGEKFL